MFRYVLILTILHLFSCSNASVIEITVLNKSFFHGDGINGEFGTWTNTTTYDCSATIDGNNRLFTVYSKRSSGDKTSYKAIDFKVGSIYRVIDFLDKLTKSDDIYSDHDRIDYVDLVFVD